MTSGSDGFCRVKDRATTTRDNEGMAHRGEETVAFRLSPPVAIGAPLLVGGLATLLWGDPVDLGGWRGPLGWVLVLLLVLWGAFASRSGSCMSGSMRRTTTTGGGCVAGCDRTGGITVGR